jgi:hypothetical protein
MLWHTPFGAMTKPLPLTQAGVRRAIRAAQSAGLRVVGIRPDGTVLTQAASELTAPLELTADLEQDGERSERGTSRHSDGGHRIPLSEQREKSPREAVPVRGHSRPAHSNREKRGTPEFARAYAKAVEVLRGPAPPLTEPTGRKIRKPFPPETLGWLGTKYFASDEFRKLDSKSQTTRRSILEACFEEPHTDDDPEPMGFCPLKYFSPQKVYAI